MSDSNGERLVESRVTYSTELGGKFYIVENVPARVNADTGERYFSPQVVERLHEIIRQNKPPSRTIETPVYDFEE